MNSVVISRHVDESVQIGDHITISVEQIEEAHATMRIDKPCELIISLLASDQLLHGRHSIRREKPWLASHPRDSVQFTLGIGQRIEMEGCGIELLDIIDERVRLQIESPNEVSVHRLEVYEVIQKLTQEIRSQQGHESS